MTTKTRLASLERAVTQCATMAQKTVQEMSDEELREIAGVDMSRLSDEELMEIIAEGTTQ